ncbi:MAG: ABC transporter ATP-binding protein [Clostridiales bacterium]|nr:ABC transporter ATP-binding protein [Clostridiales bacterium]
MKQLLGYLKPHKWTMFFATILVLFIIVIELYRPIIIGNAIDNNINGYSKPYLETTKDGKEAVSYKDVYLTKNFSENDINGNNLYQIVLFDDNYYMIENIDKQQSEMLQKATNEELKSIISNATLLDKEDLKEVRKYDFNGILYATGLYLLIMLIGFVLNVINTLMLQNMGQKIIFKMRKQVFEYIHSLSLSFFNKEPVGKLVTRVTNDTESINELFTTILIKLFKNVVKIFGFAVVMFYKDVKLASLAFLMLPIVGVLTFMFKHFSRVAYRITRNKITELNTFLAEHISGMKLIQIFAKEKEKYEEFENKSEELYRANWREVMTFAIFRPCIYFVSIIALIIIIGNGSSSVLNGTLSVGTLYIFISYINSFFEPIQELAEQFGTLQSSIASSEKIFSILEEKPDIISPKNPKDININGKIEFKNVWFAYEDEDYILKDVSFTINEGEKVAFVGATGAGKSSILNLIGRYFDIQKGEILIDGVNIKDIDIDVLRGAIGQVQQDVFIFTGDIKSNISLNNENITNEKIIQSAKMVNASSFIEKLNNKYDEPVTERGSTLSAGQRQLLSFARTLAYDPKILVLDEATSNIDTETEELITKALETLMNDRTTIMVAHRLSTIQHADKIIVMHKGEIKESGNHQQLISKNGIYKRLYDVQLDKKL